MLEHVMKMSELSSCLLCNWKLHSKDDRRLQKTRSMTRFIQQLEELSLLGVLMCSSPPPLMLFYVQVSGHIHHSLCYCCSREETLT